MGPQEPGWLRREALQGAGCGSHLPDQPSNKLLCPGQGTQGCCLPGRGQGCGAEQPLKLVLRTLWVTMHAWVSLLGEMRGCLR